MNLQTSFLYLFMVLFAISCKDASKPNKLTLNEENSILVQDKIGGEVRVPLSPKRVVVFNLAALDILDEMGLETNVIGFPKGVVPEYLQKFKNDESITNTGSLKEPNFQIVNELKPDLILIGTRQQADYKEFSKIAPTLLHHADYEDYIGSISENLIRLGKIFQMENKAEKLNEAMLQNLSQHKISEEKNPPKGLIVMFNKGKFSAYGKASRFGFIHDYFGVAPVSENLEVSTHGNSISSEYIQEQNPEILYIIDRNAAISQDEIDKSSIENPLVQQTEAFKNNKIIYLNPEVWYLAGGGLHSIKIMAEEISQGF